jgi:uncharacterized membrane-anchored protein
MFRGNYASLSYEISSLPANLLRGVPEKKFKNSDELFVLLNKDGDCWQAAGIYRRMPSDGKVYLRGRLGDFYGWQEVAAEGRKLRINYGIESFFLNEKRAKEVERVNSRWQGRNWKEIQQERERRITGLDPEIQRIHRAYIDEYWVKKLAAEIDSWLKEGLIDLKIKESILKKYNSALKQIKDIEQGLTTVDSASQKTVLVEVAVDHHGNGYPVRLLVDGKEYR